MFHLWGTNRLNRCDVAPTTHANSHFRVDKSQKTSSPLLKTSLSLLRTGGRARGLLRCLESGLYSRINALSHFVFYTDPKPFILLYFMRKLVDCLNICDNASTQLNKIYNKGLLVSWYYYAELLMCCVYLLASLISHHQLYSLQLIQGVIFLRL